MACDMGLECLTEGVETAEQFDRGSSAAQAWPNTDRYGEKGQTDPIRDSQYTSRGRTKHYHFNLPGEMISFLSGRRRAANSTLTLSESAECVDFLSNVTRRPTTLFPVTVLYGRQTMMELLGKTGETQ